MRHIALTGKVRVLMTNLFDTDRFPVRAFGDLYHQRWRIKEAFKRLKSLLKLEHVSGLSQQAVVQDVAAKIMCGNLQALVALAAHHQADLRALDRINHSYVNPVIKRAMPALLFGKKVAKYLRETFKLLGKHTYRYRESRQNRATTGPNPQIHDKETMLKARKFLNLGELGIRSMSCGIISIRYHSPRKFPTY